MAVKKVWSTSLKSLIKRVEKVTDYLQMGQEVPVKVLEVDRQGRIRLSIKEATEQSQPAAAPEAPAAEQGE